MLECVLLRVVGFEVFTLNITNLIYYNNLLFTIASFKDHLVGEESVVDYLLFWLNKNEEFGYVDSLGLEAPTDNVTELLFYMCVQRNLRRKIRHVDGNVFFPVKAP
jgi:hypothetical protein